jgi:hypothetical protein
MPTINWDAIEQKAKQYLQTPEGKKKVQQYTDSIVLGKATPGTTAKHFRPPEDAADKFIEILQGTISNLLSTGGGYSDGKLGATAVDALTKLAHSAVTKVGENLYTIEVNFTEDLSRQSLAPDRYDDIKNVAALLNHGYSAGHTVVGIWHGHGDEPIHSLAQRSGAYFIEEAKRIFMQEYAPEYGVVDVKVNDIYEDIT